MGGDVGSMREACARARHEGNLQEPLGETVRGVMGRACSIIESECVNLAELLIRPLVLLSQSLEVGLPQARQDIIDDLQGQRAPWHSVVVSDSTLYFGMSKTDP
eukprot:3458747-Alexandrium_andersonii.AAC.1